MRMHSDIPGHHHDIRGRIRRYEILEFDMQVVQAIVLKQYTA